MKYGLLVFNEAENLGDDIQSYAAAQFLPRVDYLIDRENLDSFVPSERELVATITNTWILRQRYNWPPSPYILPHLISMHFSRWDLTGSGKPDYIKGLSLEYSKQHGEIGCRDRYTEKNLNACGAPSYFSACLTLTINKLPNLKKQGYILLVNPDADIEKKLRSTTTRNIKTVTDFVDVETHNKMSWEDREKKVVDFLSLIQEADLVIADRLHSVLPSLALETKVLLIDDTAYDERLEDYLPILHHTSKEKFLSGESGYDIDSPSENKQDYLELRKSLDLSCTSFMDEISKIAKPPECLPAVEDFKSRLQELSFQKDVFSQMIARRQEVNRKLADTNDDLQNSIDGIEAENQFLIAQRITLWQEKESLRYGNEDLKNWADGMEAENRFIKLQMVKIKKGNGRKIKQLEQKIKALKKSVRLHKGRSVRALPRRVIRKILRVVKR